MRGEKGIDIGRREEMILLYRIKVWVWVVKVIMVLEVGVLCCG